MPMTESLHNDVEALDRALYILTRSKCVRSRHGSESWCRRNVEPYSVGATPQPDGLKVPPRRRPPVGDGGDHLRGRIECPNVQSVVRDKRKVERDVIANARA